MTEALPIIESFNTPLSDKQITVLMQDLKAHRVASRRQGGANLSYLETWDVKAMLIRVFGFAGFSAENTNTTVLRMEKDAPAFTGSANSRTRKMDEDGNPAFNWNVTAMCTVQLTIHQTGAVYTETAAASQTGPDVGEVTDFAIKTAESDALKRAAIYLGTQFGLSLYNSGSKNDVVMVVVAPGQERAPDGSLTAEQQAEAVTSLGLRTATAEDVTFNEQAAQEIP